MTEATRKFDALATAWDNDPIKAARAQAVADAIRREVPLRPGMQALEYGCGTGLLGFALAPFPGTLTLADASEGMLEVLRRKIAATAAPNMGVLKLDLTTAAPPAARYELVCLLMVLHHIPDTDAILRQFRALLAPGGHLCIADLDPDGGAFHGPGFDGHNGFDRTALAGKARAAGFTHVRFTTAYENPRKVGGAERLFPVFLMVAERA
jgi:2-polyprenyl-3-methyl-5-hydroxy-6-metoxy-1,4-benzoquinol methylase